MSTVRRRRENQIQVYLADDDLDRLDELADERDLSRSATVRQLLREGLNGLTKQAKAS